MHDQSREVWLAKVERALEELKAQEAVRVASESALIRSLAQRVEPKAQPARRRRTR